MGLKREALRKVRRHFAGKHGPIGGKVVPVYIVYARNTGEVMGKGFSYKDAADKAMGFNPVAGVTQRVDAGEEE